MLNIETIGGRLQLFDKYSVITIMNLLNLKKILNYLSVLLGGLLTLVGVAFIFMYFWEAIISTIGDPDQSLIFWYLPILFLGFIVMLGGFTLLAQGLKRARKNR